MPATVTFKATDRCDSCGAQAKASVLLTKDSPSVLMFCGHHYQRHSKALAALSAREAGGARVLLTQLK